MKHVLIVLLGLMAGGAAEAGSQKPSRSDCITGFSVDWSRLQEDRHDVKNRMRIRPYELGELGPLAAIVWAHTGGEVYLQYSEDCSRKADFAQRLMSLWKDRGMNLPIFSRIDDPIVPSTSTIDVRGDAWRD